MKSLGLLIASVLFRVIAMEDLLSGVNDIYAWLHLNPHVGAAALPVRELSSVLEHVSTCLLALAANNFHDFSRHRIGGLRPPGAVLRSLASHVCRARTCRLLDEAIADMRQE